MRDGENDDVIERTKKRGEMCEHVREGGCSNYLVKYNDTDLLGKALWRMKNKSARKTKKGEKRGAW